MQDCCLGMFFDKPNVTYNFFNEKGVTKKATFLVGTANKMVIYYINDP